MLFYSKKLFFLIFTLFFATCNDSDTSNDETSFNEDCRLDISLSHEWSSVRNNTITFLIRAENIGESTIHTIVVTANLYFKNDNIIKSRFYLNELDLLPGEKLEEYGIFSETNTKFLSTPGLSNNDLDRIIYNAPFYTCLDN